MEVEYENEDEDEYSDKDEEIEDDEYTDMFEEESDSEDDDFDDNALFKLTTAAEQYTFNSVSKWPGRPSFSAGPKLARPIKFYGPFDQAIRAGRAVRFRVLSRRPGSADGPIFKICL